jgi:hypothetical protein
MAMTEPSNAADSNRTLLRHSLATIAYRGGKAVRNAPAGFADFHANADVRTPGQILGHIGDLFDWALSMAEGRQKWQDSKPLPWEQEMERFYTALTRFDDFLASGSPVQVPVERLFQGPVADALAHVGQIALLRRMAASPIQPENYSKAEITVGRVGADQSSPKREF